MARGRGLRSMSLIGLAMVLLAAQACEFRDAAVDAGQNPPDVRIDLGGVEDPGMTADTGEPQDNGEPQETVVQGPADWVTNADWRPISVHASWEGDPATSVVLQWQTRGEPAGYVPMAWIVPAADVASQAPDAAMPYAPERVVVGTGFEFETFGVESLMQVRHWEVRVEGLAPATHYRYRVGTWSDFDEEAGTLVAPDLSPVHEVKTAPSRGSRAPFRFVSAGDSRGGTRKIRDHIERLVALDADFWLFNGDMTEIGSQPEWDVWFDAMGPLLGRRVLMPTLGNHEVFAELFFYNFAMPRDPLLPVDLQEHAYSFDVGNAHFVVLDSNTSDLVQAQKDWLASDLALANADPDIDWKIVMFHHPAYSASTAHGSTQRILDHWIPILEQHDVDLTFSGHDHNYERTHPIRGRQVAYDGLGVVHVVAGGFYSPGYSSGRDWWTVVSHNGEKSNYTVVDVAGDSLTLRAYSGDGNELLDEFTLTR